jgi:uncharacterized membrane protein (UPF0127 family)
MPPPGHSGPMPHLTTAGGPRFPPMLWPFACALLALGLALAACAPAAPSAASALPRIELKGERDTVHVRVEVVDTPETRQRGLMGRPSLDEDAGMLFIWPEDASSSFFMKDTLIPLSIAFIADDGTVLRILDMEPCASDPCPLYDPRTSYRMALEVRQGSFARWGVREGDRARLVR